VANLVTGGYGLPEEGSLVAGGMGPTQTPDEIGLRKEFYASSRAACAVRRSGRNILMATEAPR
jgi:hypothetical protein